MNPTKVAIRGSTQDFLEILDIRDDLVLLKDGSVTMVVQVSAVNFGLLSEKEQAAIIFAYAEFLNSLNFAIQIVVRTQKKDISQYLARLEAFEKQANPNLSSQIQKYRQFILQTIKENNVLDKKFYIVIPFSSLELGVGTTASGLFKRRKNTLPLPPETILQKAAVTLTPKRDHVLRQVGRLGLRAKQLTSPELVELFYGIYNPGKEKPNGQSKVTFEPITVN